MSIDGNSASVGCFSLIITTLVIFYNAKHSNQIFERRPGKGFNIRQFTRRTMAGLFDRQASEYAEARPEYPAELFSFIASHTPNHDVAWDVGTGTGQSALPLSRLYRQVIATDISEAQLRFAPKRANIRYAVTTPAMSVEEVESTIGPAGSVDLVTVAQALHWFPLDSFYARAKHVLRKPGGVLAAWCYKEPTVNGAVDEVFGDLYRASAPFWEPPRWIVDEEYTTLRFPLEEVAEGPLRFQTSKDLTVDEFLQYIRTWSAFQTALARGVQLLNAEMVNRFKEAWGSDGAAHTVTWPIFLRIGSFSTA